MTDPILLIFGRCAGGYQFCRREEPPSGNEILKCADRVAASGVGWSVLPPAPSITDARAVQKVLCGSIDRDVQPSAYRPCWTLRL